jgi:large subunit ribosomal protein L22
MLAKAEAKYLRVSPVKLRRIANLIRYKKINEALDILKFLKIGNKKYFVKLLNSVKANAKIKNPDVKEDNLFIKELYVNEGPRLKRIFPRPRGMASLILKRTSHIKIVVSDGQQEEK